METLWLEELEQEREMRWRAQAGTEEAGREREDRRRVPLTQSAESSALTCQEMRKFDRLLLPTSSASEISNQSHNDAISSRCCC